MSNVIYRHDIPTPNNGWGDDPWQGLIREIKELATNANFARRSTDWQEMFDNLAAIRDLLTTEGKEASA